MNISTQKTYYVIYIPSKAQWLEKFENDKPVYTGVIREAALYLESELNNIKEDLLRQMLNYEIQEYKEA